MQVAALAAVLSLTGALGWAPAAQAEPEPAGWLDGPHLTGTWGGARERLAKRGLDVYGRYTAGFWSNLDGGSEKGTRYEGFAEWGLDVDLERLLGWSGGGLHIGWISYHGGMPTEDLVGAFSTTAVSDWEAEDFVRFYEIYVEQEWLGGRLLVRAGQLVTDEDFFLARSADTLLNATFGFLDIGTVQQLSPFYPLAAPGVYLFGRPAEPFFVRVGVYTADSGEDETDNVGFDWSFDEGVSFVAEVGAEWAPLGRPGLYAVGVVATSTDTPDYRSGGSADGDYGLYAMVDQTLVPDARGDPRLGVFLRGAFLPKRDRSVVRYYLDAGLEATGLLPGRERDVFSVGLAFLRFGRDYVSATRAAGDDVSRRQLLVELTYRVQVAGWLTLQPDLQLFFDPHTSRRDATVFGLRAVVEL
jgi:porin